MNVQSYIGLPYVDRGRDMRGVDCWGLVELVYRRELGIRLPDYLGWYQTADDVGQTTAAFAVGKKTWTPVEESRPGDLILLRFRGYFCHVGILTSDEDFLHVLRRRNVALERMSSVLWRDNLGGRYRWTG